MTTPRKQMLEALRWYAVSYQDSAHQLARWLDLPTTDGTALGEILWAEDEDSPLSPGRLSSRIGLTSGATNALVNRLERQGLVARSRESGDRRIVTLRATEAARERAAPFLRSSQISLEAALDEYDDRTLETVSTVLTRFAAVLPVRPGRRDRRRRSSRRAGRSPN
ncbi:MarR family transcriptional regulator [Rathayibacter caricis]|nr:helix-turn-helix domain-containing protein [Rathayibacter caricis]